MMSNETALCQRQIVSNLTDEPLNEPWGGVVMQFCLMLISTLAVSHFASLAYAQQATERTPAQLSESREQWRMLFVGGKKIGYVHNAVNTVDRDGRQVGVNQHASVIADTHTKIMIQTEETIDGDVLSFRYQVESAHDYDSQRGPCCRWAIAD